MAIGGKLLAHGLVGLSGVLAGAVDEMEQDAAALHMAEETVAEPGAFMGAGDEARNVRQHEFAAIDRDHAELRMQRGEGIIGDLRLCRAHGGEQGRFARIGQPDEAGIRDQLEAQPDGALLAGEPGIGMPRRAIGRGLEMGVAEPAIAALGEHHAVADGGEVGEQGLVVLVEDLGALGDLENDAGAVRAGAVLAHAVTAGLGLEVLLVAVVDQGVEAVDAFGDDIAAAPAIAAVGAAELDEFLAAERDAARSAVARADINFRLIEEFHPGYQVFPARLFKGSRNRCEPLWPSFRGRRQAEPGMRSPGGTAAWIPGSRKSAPRNDLV